MTAIPAPQLAREICKPKLIGLVERTVIRKGASIGSGVTILANTSIGENAIVGAGSVVTKDVPPNAIVVGNPAKVLRYIEQNVEGQIAHF